MTSTRMHPDGGPLVGVYPGTFDPVTQGHMDIMMRALHVVDRLVIGVAVNSGKNPMFSLAEREAMVREMVSEELADQAPRIEIRPFDNLLVDFARSAGSRVIVRGLRAVSDFEYEFQMVWMNRRLDPDLETMFLMASGRYQYIASSLVREIARLNGDIASFVSPRVKEHVDRRVADERAIGMA